MPLLASPPPLQFLEQFQAYRTRAFGPLLPESEARVLALVRSSNGHACAVGRKLAACCSTPLIISIDQGAGYFLAEQRCKSRVCPRCSRIRATRLAGRIADLVRRMDSPRFLTLTARSTDAPLADQVKAIRRSFATLRRRPAWKRNVSQGVYTVEITHNAKTGLWHPHLHAIIDGNYWPHRDLLDEWEAVVKDQAGVDIRAVHGITKLARYLASYVAKSCDLGRLGPDELAEWAVETHGLRLAQTFGRLHGHKPQTEETEPLPTALVDIDVNRLAYEASWHNTAAEAILTTLTAPRAQESGLTLPELTLAIDAWSRHPSTRGRSPPRMPAPGLWGDNHQATT